MWCKKCGSAIPKDAKFCSSCGTPVPGVNVQASEPKEDAVIEVQPTVVEATPVNAQSTTADTPQATTQPSVQPEVDQDSGATYNTQQTAQAGYSGSTGQAPVPPGTPQQGASYTYNTTYNTTQVPYATQIVYPRENNSGLLMAAFILNIVSTVLLGIFLIPLAWCIPMTVHSYGVYKGKKPNTVGFGVCTLLFVSLIGGILMLVAEKDA